MRKLKADRPGVAIQNEPGWLGGFTREQALGAIPNGSTIIKAKSEGGDGTPNGTPGTVLGSYSHPDIMAGAIFYFVEWSNRKRVACAVIDWKIAQAPQ